MTTTILIVEDQEIYRDGLKVFLSTVPEFSLYSEAASAEEAFTQFIDPLPELVLMDIRLPGMSGIEATRHISAFYPSVRVIILSMVDDDPSVFAAMQAGALGYLLKDTGHTKLLRAIQAVAEGEAIFSAGIAVRMIRYFAKSVPSQGTEFSELTKREHEILTLIAQNYSTADIARTLDVRSKTVRNHVSNILSKLHVTSRAEAAQRARDRGL